MSLSDSPRTQDDPNAPRQRRVTALALAALLCFGALYLAVRVAVPREPEVFSRVGAVPISPILRQGAWYWLERANGERETHLVRVAAASRVQRLAVADVIGSYDVADGKVVWTAREGNRWSIYAGSAAGDGRANALWSGRGEPQGIRLIAGQIFWLTDGPAAVPGGAPLPPLASTLQVHSLAPQGGAPVLVTTLLETRGGQVIGLQAGDLYVSAFRPGTPGCMVVYRVPVRGGATPRIVGEVGRYPMLLARDGSLYWIAQSRESSNASFISSVRRLGGRDGGGPETLSDWLPSGGTLCDTARGVCYLDGSVYPSLWPVARHDARGLPRPLSLPKGYYPVAASGDQILLRHADAPAADFTLHRMPLP